MNTIRNEEKRVFLNAFLAYIYPLLEEVNAIGIVKAKDGVTVEFEFYGKNNKTTVKQFENDLIFAYKIAVEVIREESAKRKNWDFHIDGKKPDDRVILAINH